MGSSIKMDYLTLIKDLFSGLGSIGVLIVVFAFWKMGFFEKKNGNGYKAEFESLRAELELIKGNHLPHLQEALLDIKEELKSINDNSKESLFILKDIKEDLKK